MSTIKALNLGSLDQQAAARVRSWTFPSFRHLLEGSVSVRHPSRGDRRQIQPLAFTAYDGAQPAGLVLGCIPNGQRAPDLEMPNDPEVLSLYVTPSQRGRGVGAGLLRSFECEVKRAGFPRVTAVYMTGNAETERLERLLARDGWSPPETRMRVFKSTMQQARSTPWFQRYQPDSRLVLFPWSEMRPEDLARLKASHQATNWIADDLIPWHYDTERLDTASSIGVRMNGDVVGWVINHRISEDTVRFTCSFMRRDLSRRARLLPAMSESICRAEKAGYQRMMFTVPAHHVEMTRFAERWCAPWTFFRAETRSSQKELVPHSKGDAQ